MGPGAGAAIASALTKGAKPAADKAVDALIASPEFIAATRSSTVQGQRAAVHRLAASAAFSRFLSALKQPMPISERERWLLDALRPAPLNIMQGGREEAPTY